MRTAAFWIALSLLLLGGCATVVVENRELEAGQRTATVPVRWRIDPRCLDGAAQWPRQTREDIARDCPDPSRGDQISIAMSGGGSKAGIFGAETLFYLDALGLAHEVSVLSTVSGGSFAGALYALSCDPGDTLCLQPRPNGRTRPVWRHDTVMGTLGQGNSNVVNDQTVRVLVPFMPASESADRFAYLIDRDLFGGGTGDPFRFADVNPKRPHLFLNATITSDNRGGLGSHPRLGCPPLDGRGYLRRRTPDEYFHFAFSDYYFGLLRSRVSDYPLAAGVASSAAFPALIDFAVLKDHCGTTGKDDTVRLTDGGANDNQGLVEIYLIIAELVFQQHRSELWHSDPAMLELLRPDNRAFVFVVNSSVTETTGDRSNGGGTEPYGVLGLISDVVHKVLTTIDVFTAEGYNLRKQSYLAQAETLRAFKNHAPIYATEFSLTELDQYALGGTEAALRHKAHIEGDNATDFTERLATLRTARQQRAYREIVDRKEIRRALHLSDYHPQCYFDMREKLDSSLVRLDEEDQACLREAARWAGALRAQELCDQNDKLTARPSALACPGGSPRLRTPQVLMDDPVRPSQCTGRIEALIATQAAARAQTREPPPAPEVLCRLLD